MILKTCKICNVAKELNFFTKKKKALYGVHQWCKNCFSSYNKNRYEQNKDQIKNNALNYYKENKEKRQQYKKDNAEKINKYSRDYYKKNPVVYKIQAVKRRANMLHATPVWLNEDQHKNIKSIYNLCKEKEIETGLKWHVDHIVPLLGSNVCGLHVPWNLQVITAKQNLTKGNKVF